MLILKKTFFILFCLAGHHELSTLTSADTLSKIHESERQNLITVDNDSGAAVPTRNHINNGHHHATNGKMHHNGNGGAVHTAEIVDGMTVLNKNQFLVSATVHMVDA